MRVSHLPPSFCCWHVTVETRAPAPFGRRNRACSPRPPLGAISDSRRLCFDEGVC